MSESECEFCGLLRHKYTVDVRFYLFTVGFRKCRIIYGRINETPLYISPDEEPMRFENVCGIKDVEI